MKRYGFLAGIAFLVLSCLSVYYGGLNQDEGWYLYAAQMVKDGNLLYRDFAYTQAPLMPLVYSRLAFVWETFGLLGARVLTLSIGLAGILAAVALARRMVPPERRGVAGLVTFFLLGCNLYHLYYLAIPKTYALAGTFAVIGFLFLSYALEFASCDDGCAPSFARRFAGAVSAAVSGLALAFAAGSRISLGALLAVTGVALLVAFRRYRFTFLWFGLGGAFGLVATFGPFLLDHGARAGFFAAQAYHAARGGFDPLFTAGSVSRLVRWYLPVFVLFGYALFTAPKEFLKGFEAKLALFGFLAVFAVQIVAPFPYEDYQVPVMALLAVFVATRAPAPKSPLLALGLAFACAFGNPMLEKWTVNGQDRFWSLKKQKSELRQLQDIARIIEAIDPGGKTLLTQDLYLAIETHRRVPRGLEMGPFSQFTDEEWLDLLRNAEPSIAALSGYTFAIDPPACTETPMEKQMQRWNALKNRYDLVLKEDMFGQNATTLLILKRRNAE